MKKLLLLSIFMVTVIWAKAQVTTTELSYNNWSPLPGGYINTVTPGGSAAWANANDNANYYPAGTNTSMLYKNGTGTTAIEDWFISGPIALSGAIAYTTYKLQFDFRMNYYYQVGKAPYNLTNGFNNADITVKLSTDAGVTWSGAIWSEDNSAQLQLAKSVNDPTKNFVIPASSSDPLANDRYYTATLDIGSSYIGQTINIGFQYKSLNGSGGWFYIDNVKLIRTGPSTVADLWIWPDLGTYYTKVPYSQVKTTYPVNAIVKNQGINMVATQIMYVSETSPIAKNNIGYTTLNPLNTYDSISVSSWTVPYSLAVNPVKSDGSYITNPTTYTYDFNPSPVAYTVKDPKTFTINDKILQRFSNTANTLDLGSSANSKYNFKVGVEFLITNKDHLKGININYASTGAEFELSIVNKATSAIVYGPEIKTSSIGSALYTLKDASGNTELLLPAGTYYVFVSQKTSTALKINYDTDGGKFVYYNSSSVLTEESKLGDLAINLEFLPNRKPQLTNVGWTGTNGLQTQARPVWTSSNVYSVYVGEEFSLKLNAEDLDREAITFRKQGGTFVPAWLGVTDNGDTTFTVKGKPLTGNIGTNTISVSMYDGVDSSMISLTVAVVARPTSPVFNGAINVPFTTVFPNDWWKRITNSSKTWAITSNTAQVAGDSKDQDETLFTNAMYIPNTGTDTVYYFSFDWKNDFANNCAISGNDLADIEISASTDFGATWASLWQDDDQTKVMNGKPFTQSSNPKVYLTWPYNGSTTYTSEYNMNDYKGKHVMFKFNYKGKNGGTFLLDNVKLERFTAAGTLTFAAYSNYLTVPFKHRSANKFGIRLINNSKVVLTTVNKLQGYIDYTSGTLYSNTRIYTGTLDVTGVPINDTSYVQFTPVFNYWMKNGIAGNSSLSLNFLWAPTPTVNPGALPGAYSTTITQDNNSVFIRDNGTYSGTRVPAIELDYNSLGTDFTLVAEDYLKKVDVTCTAPTNADVSISIYKKSGNTLVLQSTYSKSAFTLTTAAQVATYTFTKPLKLPAGDYIIFVEELAPANPVAISIENAPSPNSYYFRGKGTSYKTILDKGNLAIRPYVYNEAPIMTTGTLSSANDKVAYESLEYSAKLSAYDKEGSIPKYLAYNLPAWLVLTDNGDGSAILKGTPTAVNVGFTNFQIKLHDGADTSSMQNYVIEVKGNPAPYFITSPITEAKQGVVYTYTAAAKDMFGEALTLTALQKPAWLTFTATNSAGTAVLTGTPAAGDVGNTVIQIKVADAIGKLTVQMYTLTVSSAITVAENKLPVFTSTPVLTAQQGVAYSYKVKATDANTGDILSIGVAAGTQLPGWLTLTPGTSPDTATLAGTPSANNVGENQVTLTVSDGKASVEQSFRITVKAANALPVISSTPVATAKENVLYVYNITATDADKQNLVVFAPSLPSWLKLISTGSGKATLEGTPKTINVGSHQVKITVSDGIDNVSQDFTIVVSALTNTAPVISSAAPTTATQDQLYTYNITATDADGQSLRFGASLLPSWLSIVDYLDGTAKITGTPGKQWIGVNKLTVTVTDGITVTEQKSQITVTAATGTKSESEVTVYPNPSFGTLNITNTVKSMVYIFDSNGKLLMNKLGSSDLRFDVNGLTNGNYHIKIVKDDGTIINKTFILVK